MFLRDKIEAAITAAQGDNKEAAMNVCVLLNQEMELSGNGWFEGDDELGAVLQAQEAASVRDEGFVESSPTFVEMLHLGRAHDFDVINYGSPKSASVTAYDPFTLPLAANTGGQNAATCYFKGIVRDAIADPFKDVVQFVRVHPSSLTGLPPGQSFGQFEAMESLDPEEQIVIARQQDGWQVMVGKVSEGASVFTGIVTHEELNEFSVRSIKHGN
ncbi:hypothetical protein [Pseudomonas sp. UMAB-40]|uniref:hypothetical protein n=1 Tax=Pseudomonas sp. UMAB-40 TaxID=1365407 RepID=UPI001C566418|nr:hypothetical protein [Pseudomonas sp. UMAB-40]